MILYLVIHRGAVIRVLADILRESGKEKVTRIIIATLRVRATMVIKNETRFYKYAIKLQCSFS